MDDRSKDIFGPVEENYNDSVGEEEEPEEEQEKDQISNIFGEKGEVEDEKPDYDPCRPLRQKVGHDLKELYMNEVKQFLDKGKSQSYALIVTRMKNSRQFVNFSGLRGSQVLAIRERGIWAPG